MKNVLSIINKRTIALVAIAGLIVAPLTLVATPAGVYAANKDEVQNGVNAIGGNDVENKSDKFGVFIENIINILLFLIGAIAVIMIIVGGIRYTTSGGDANQAKSAKDTILYAIIGLVVAMMAYAIVNWVIKQL